MKWYFAPSKFWFCNAKILPREWGLAKVRKTIITFTILYSKNGNVLVECFIDPVSLYRIKNQKQKVMKAF